MKLHQPHQHWATSSGKDLSDIMKLHQPHQHWATSPGKDLGLRKSCGFPDYLKETDILDNNNNHLLKLTASNNLFHAVLKGRVRGTRLLLDRGTSVNGRNDYGYSVLTAALHIDDDLRRRKLFRLLLDRGADPHYKDITNGRSVVHWAALLGRTEQVKVLLQEVAGDLNLHDKDHEGHTALHHAVMAGHLATVTTLVDMYRRFGVSVDVPDRLGLTPYLHAKRLGYRDLAAYLLDEGLASPGQGDMLFRTPREWSQIGKFERQKAVELHKLEAINFAKINGKITQIRHLEDSIASPLLDTALPGLHPAGALKARRTAGQATDRLSLSLPSLQEQKPGDNQRPFSANGAAHDRAIADPSRCMGRPREAFASETAVAPLRNHRQIGRLSQGLVRAAPWEVPLRSTEAGSWNTLALIEMNQKGRHARSYRQSQFDETKASEYKHILGSLNSFMDILSQQQSKSFRQSVKCQRPETPKRVKPKNKVSSLAVILGREKGHKRSSKKRPPKSSVKKDKGGSGDRKTSALEKRRSIVPVLKVNDKIV